MAMLFSIIVREITMSYQIFLSKPFSTHLETHRTRQKASKGRHRHLRHQGQALIEMALVVIVLLFLTLGLIQYGLLANAKITMANLSREGARFAAVNGTRQTAYGPGRVQDNGEAKFNPDSIRGRVLYIASSTTLNDMDDSNILIDPPSYDPKNPPTSGKTLISVTISYNLSRKLILPSSFPGLNRFTGQTQTKATMVLE
jgi:Flp pilus assembly protein TadG